MAKKHTRRKVVASVGGFGAIGVAGCIGGGDDVESIVVGNPGGGSSQSATQAIQRVAANESDIVEISTTETGGDPASIRLYNEGELDAFTTANDQIGDAVEGVNVFEGEDLEMPYQSFTFMRRDDYFMAREDTDIETTDDMLGRDNWLLPPAWGSRALLERIFDNDPELKEGMFENVVDIDTSDLAGALAEENVEAFNAYGVNSQILPSWIGEVDARVDVKYLELTDPFREVFEEGLTEYYDGRDIYGWEQDVGTDTIEGHQNALNFYFDPDISSEAIYEILSLTYEYHNDMRDGWPAFFDYPDQPSAYVAGISEELAPVHPGAVEFYEEMDLWEDHFPEP